jgi:Lrp/AsnC family leucine-responsive transcriptional regulator
MQNRAITAGLRGGEFADQDELALAYVGLPRASSAGRTARIQAVPGQPSKIAASISTQRPGRVSECHRITGEDCFLAEVHAATVPELGQPGVARQEPQLRRAVRGR